jgi:hypothetical protein
MTTAARPFIPSALAQDGSHAHWLAAAQAKPEERFWYEPLVESGLVPDRWIRAAIRRMLKERLRAEDRGREEANRARLLAFVEEMKRSPIALRTESANAQHYEVPAAFFGTRCTGTWLRPGFAYAVDGGTVPQQPHHRRVQFGVAARLHRSARRGAGAWQCAHRHGGTRSTRTGTTTTSCPGKCSSTCEIGRRYSSALRAG